MPSNELVISLSDRTVGMLTATRRGARFRYDSGIARDSAGQPLLSLSLPVKARPYAEGPTGAWFRGLLPEGQRLQAISRNIGCDDTDYFSILRRIGWECAGAVSIRETDFEPPREGPPHELTETDLAKRLEDLPTYGGINPLARVSLGGYQEKLLAVGRGVVIRDGLVTEAVWWEPSATEISTHIIKPQPQGRYEGIVEAEAWAMGVAGHAARCAKTGVLRLCDAPLSLVVERYDRSWNNDECRRIHQEDCCQAMGIDPSDKYAGYDRPRGTDPSYLKIAHLLEAYAKDPGEEHKELLRQLIVNVVLGNVDAHAKNYSFLYRRIGIPELSPLYDVVPVTDIEPRATYLSMRIGGAIEFHAVGREQVLTEAQGWGMLRKDAESTLDDTLAHLEDGLAHMKDVYPNAAKRHEQGARRRARVLGYS